MADCSGDTWTTMRDAVRWPAEWEPHAATWLSWPHNRDTWPGRFEHIEPAFARLVEAIADAEPVLINVLDEQHLEHVHAKLSRVSGDIRLIVLPTNDAWCRDHGATFVQRKEGPQAVDFVYNGWGGKYPPFDRDAEVAGRMAELTGSRRRATDVVLEGGAIDGNGDGVLLTTASCVLNPNRNPGLSLAEAESALSDLLGCQEIVWVEGDLHGDDTDGHIDNLARFTSPTDVVYAAASNTKDVHHAVLAAGRSRLQERLAPLGIRVHALPLPHPVFMGDQRLPASHANFYITNRSVVMPAYGGDSDREAAAVLSELMPDRQVVPIDCLELVWGLGAVHCLTQQVPAGVALPAGV